MSLENKCNLFTTTRNTIVKQTGLSNLLDSYRRKFFFMCFKLYLSFVYDQLYIKQKNHLVLNHSEIIQQQKKCHYMYIFSLSVSFQTCFSLLAHVSIPCKRQRKEDK